MEQNDLKRGHGLTGLAHIPLFTFSSREIPSRPLLPKIGEIQSSLMVIVITLQGPQYMQASTSLLKEYQKSGMDPAPGNGVSLATHSLLDASMRGNRQMALPGGSCPCG